MTTFRAMVLLSMRMGWLHGLRNGSNTPPVHVFMLQTMSLIDRRSGKIDGGWTLWSSLAVAEIE